MKDKSCKPKPPPWMLWLNPVGKKKSYSLSSYTVPCSWGTESAPTPLPIQLAEDYGHDPTVTSLLDTMDIFFEIVTNPDGYAFTHSSVSAGTLRGDMSQWLLPAIMSRNVIFGWHMEVTSCTCGLI